MVLAAVALATLDVFQDEQTLVQIQPKIERLRQHLDRIKANPHVGDVRQRGLIAGIELVRDRPSKEPFPWSEKRGLKVCEFALGEGVWLRPLGNVIYVLPPYCITTEQLDRVYTVITQFLAHEL